MRKNNSKGDWVYSELNLIKEGKVRKNVFFNVDFFSVLINELYNL